MIPARKRQRFNYEDIKPLPVSCQCAIGYFTGLDVEIFEERSMKGLADMGCFGLASKPRQVLTYSDKNSVPSISRNEYQRKLMWQEKFGSLECERKVSVDEELFADPFDIPRSLILMPEEAFFLQKEIECLEIQDLNGKKFTTEELWVKFCNLKYNFVETYVAYVFCKSKNWVIKPGSKFGGQFLLYKQNPQAYHATYIVKILDENIRFGDYKTNERIAETTKKCMLYLEIFHPEGVHRSDYLENLDKFRVKEIAMQRHMIKNNQLK